MATLSTDTFNRTNSTSVVGSTDGAGTLDPLTWTTQLGTCGIISNQAYASALVSGGGLSPAGEATVNLPADADVSLTFVTLGQLNGLIFRFVDISNFWMWTSDVAGHNSKLYRLVGASLTQVGTSHASAADGDVMRVVTSGSSISCYRNGTLLESQTSAQFSTATKWGYLTQATSARFDTWSASGAESFNRSLSVTQTQTPTLTSVRGKSLSFTQTQTPTVSLVKSFNRSLSVTQTQTPTIPTPGKTVNITVAVTQTQV